MNNNYTIQGVNFYFEEDSEDVTYEAKRTQLSLAELDESVRKDVLVSLIFFLLSKQNKNGLLIAKLENAFYKELVLDFFEELSIMDFHEKYSSLPLIARDSDYLDKSLKISIQFDETDCIIESFNPIMEKDSLDILFYFQQSTCVVVFNSEKIAQEYIEIYVHTFKMISKNLSILKFQKFNELDLLYDFEKELFITKNYDFTKPLYQLFEEQAQISPDSIAFEHVMSDGGKDIVTFKEMDLKSSVLAKILQDKYKVNLETAVGVYMDRSVNSAVALLAVLKAGGVYVPIERHSPDEMIAEMLTEVCPAVVISTEQEKMISKNQLRLSLSDLGEDATYKKRNTIENTSIIMYTSGSTGKPKGVKHKQLQVINRLNYMWEVYPFNKSDVVSQRTMVNYMPSMWEFLGGLLKGRKTVIISDEIVKDPYKLAQVVQECKVTYLTIVPSLFRMLSNLGDTFKLAFKEVKVWICCGEPMTADFYNDFRKNFSEALLINDYGATEVNGMLYFDSSFPKKNSYDLPGMISVPNVEVYILDDEKKLLPHGFPGTIYIGGISVSTGYLNDQQLNKEKFVQVKIKGKQIRLFNVGDKGVRLHDGSYLVLGRMDNQIKIRGIRVNIDGIESIIQRYESVERNVVIVKQQKSGNPYLTALIKAKNEIDMTKLREFVGSYLPEYMVPTQFISVNEFPLLKNGKIDRKELTKKSIESDGEKSLKLENIIKIAADIIEVPVNSINPDKRFYENGFDSVSIVEFMKKVNGYTSEELTVSQIYDYSTITELFRYIMSHKSGKNRQLYVAKEVHTEKANEEVETEDLNMWLTIIQEECQKYLKTSLTIHDCSQHIFTLGMTIEQLKEMLGNLNNRFGLKLSLADVFKYSSIEELATYIVDFKGSSKKQYAEQSSLEDKSHRALFERPHETNVELESISTTVIAEISEIIGVSASTIKDDTSFEELGMTLADIRMLINQLEIISLAVNHDRPVDLGTTVRSFSSELKYIEKSDESILDSISIDLPKKSSLTKPLQIAIVGISCRYAEAKNKEELWHALLNGKEYISEVTPTRWDSNKFYSEKRTAEKTYSKWAASMEEVHSFDYSYFGISKSEASVMDPQQKIVLEEMIHAIEDSGKAISDLSGTLTGVYLGCRQGDYDKTLEKKQIPITGYSFMGTDLAITSARVSYLLNFKGPNMIIDTACSSSLTAIHQAVNGLSMHDCDVALAGGVAVMSTEHIHVSSSQMGMLSASGKASAFDDSADGFVPGEGCGILVLKRLADAEQDGDRIYGTIIGSSLNQDGKTNGITAPSMEAQSQLQLDAYKKYQIDPSEITYVEAHGTGTKLGDPIEVAALTRSFEELTEKKQFCGIGSVKNNIGHTIAASGVAGVIKVLLSLKNEIIPKTINYEKENEHISFKNTPFYVTTENRKWPKKGNKNLRKAAVNSFGFGGSSAHVIIEEYLDKKPLKLDKESYFIPLSAKREEDLYRKAENLLNYLNETRVLPVLGNLARTLCSIEKYEYRICFIVKDCGDLKRKLAFFLENNEPIQSIGEIKEVQALSLELCFDLFINNNYEKIRENYLIGNATALDEYYKVEGYEIIELPPYPFNREICMMTNDAQYKVKDLFDQYEVGDHLVFGKPLLPGSLYISLLLNQLTPSKRTGLELNNIFFLRQTDQSDLENYLRIEKDGNTLIIQKEKEKQKVFKCEVNENVNKGFYKSVSLQERLLSLPNLLNREELYASLNDIGLTYGKKYSGLASVHFSEFEALGILSNDVSRTNETILDAGFQSIVPLLDKETEIQGRYIPVKIENLIFYGDILDVNYCCSQLISKNNEENQVFNISFFDHTGRLLAEIKSFIRTRTASLDLQIFEKVIVPVDSVKSESRYQKLLILDEKNSSTEEQNFFKEQNVYSSKLEDLLTDTNLNAEIYNQDRITKIIILNKITSVLDAEKLPSLIQTEFNYIKKVVTELVLKNRHQFIENVSIQYVFENDGAKNYLRCLVGMARSLSTEEINVRLQLIELAKSEKSLLSDYSELLRKLDVSVEENYIYIENDRLFIEKYMQSELVQDFDEIELTAPRKTYVITGGMGGIGKELSQYLVDHLEAKVYLLGRTPIKELTNSKVSDRIHYKKVDITNSSEVEELFDEFEKNDESIDGIFHCAGITDDSLLIFKQATSIKKVFAPKMIGTNNLIHIGGRNDVPFIICFSSISAVIGNSGQTDYAVANSYMDQLTSYDLPIKLYSINWGLWEDGGMGRNNTMMKKLEESFGIRPLKSETAFQTLFQVLSSNKSNTVIFAGEPSKALGNLIART